MSTSSQAQLTLRGLAERYPAVFGSPPRPLKIGIYEDMLRDLCDERAAGRLRSLLAKHTGLPAYLAEVAKGGARFDLSGAPAGEISPEAQAYAAETLSEIHAQATAKAERRALLKQYEASGLTKREFVTQHGLDHASFCTQVARANNERLARRRQRAELVHRFRESGLSREAFASKAGIALKRLEQVIAKVETLESAPPSAQPMNASAVRKAARQQRFREGKPPADEQSLS